MVEESKSWLCGTTNSIVGQQKEIDLFVDVSPVGRTTATLPQRLFSPNTLTQTETGTVEFRDPKLEKSAGLTAADRKWMDDIIKDVNEGWEEEGQRAHFRGSDDYLRQKVSETVTSDGGRP